MTVNPIRLETEDMTLGGAYRVESKGFASGGSYIGLGGSTGTATSTFTGPSGIYEVIVGYYDEADGNSNLAVSIGGNLVDQWDFDDSPGGTRAQAQNFTLRTIATNLEITNGAAIDLTGLQDAGENSRVDYIEFVYVGDLPTGEDPPTEEPPTEDPPANVAPVANNDTATTTEDDAVVINVLANDTDSDGGSLTVASFDNTSTAGGTVSQNSDGTLTYTPSNGFSGTDTFDYTVADGQGGNAVGTVTITVNPDSDPEPPGDPNPPVDPPTDPIRLETEDMTLGGAYRIEAKGFASGGSYIGLGGPTGTATSTFTGPSGIYEVIVGYYDEADGNSNLAVSIGGNLVDQWNFDDSPGGTRAQASNLLERTIATNLEITNGAAIDLTGLQDAGENSRVDYIEFVYVGEEPPTEEPPTEEPPGGSGDVADYSGATAGVILNLDTNVALSPVFGALETPRLMPLGDSITAGSHSLGAVPGGYRIQFWDRAVADGLSIDFVGSLENGSGSLGDNDHQGHRGWAINRIRNNVVGDDRLSEYPSDAILLMIGTNDVSAGASGTEIRDRLVDLIDDIVAEAPNTYVFVSSIPPLDAPRGTASEIAAANEYNSLIPAVADSYSNVYFVDAGGSLTVGDMNGDNSSTNDIDDGIHPTAAGYDKLGDAWYEGVFNPESLAGKTDLVGSNFSDQLIGNGGRNVLTGGGGEDKLTGNGGADVYVYQQVSDGLDDITDFSNNDTLWISAAGFGGGLDIGELDSSRFVLGNSSTQAVATFLFDTADNILRFDQDGTGGAHTAQAIAQFSNGFTLQASQIEVIA